MCKGSGPLDDGRSLTRTQKQEGPPRLRAFVLVSRLEEANRLHEHQHDDKRRNNKKAAQILNSATLAATTSFDGLRSALKTIFFIFSHPLRNILNPATR